jgi:hypothetical protein
MGMQNEQIIEVTEEVLLLADAYNNCCHFLIGQADVESRG